MSSPFLRTLSLVLPLLASTAFSQPLLAWKDIDQLVEDQKLEEASKAIDARLEAAKAKKAEEEWARALIRSADVRIALHGYETAVRNLREQPWPSSPVARNAVNLAYANALLTYTQAYSWEIRRREKVATQGPVDLKAWTQEQIVTEAQRAFAEIWATREGLGTTPAKAYAEYLDLGDYPDAIRGTLRDALSYLFVAALADSSSWSAEHSNEVFRLDARGLIAGDLAASARVNLADASVHPLLKLGAVLDDLEAWHRKGNRREAELEVRLERTRRLSQHFTGKEQAAQIRRDLETRLPQYRAYPWFSMGKAQQAALLRDDGQRVAARAAAEEGARAYPQSPGGKHSLALQKELEAPDYQLVGMATDGLGERSLQVTHKNLRRLFFRAYRLDLDALVENWRDYSLLPQGQGLQRLIQKGTPSAQWSVELPATPDLTEHITYVTPPLEKHGLYYVVASALETFAPTQNRVVAAAINLSDLVLTARQESSSSHGVRVVHGQTGVPMAGVTVELYQYDWNRSHKKADTKTTDASGLVEWNKAPAGTSNNSYFVIAKYKDQRAFDPQQLGFYPQPRPASQNGAFVYTDRSIYRPLQKVRWKVVAYSGTDERSDFKTLASQKVTVTLLDANRQKLETREVTTNGFGSAAGEFTLPTGRALGVWSVVSSFGGSTQVRVEEYKRPTFEAELPAPTTALRLNQPVTLSGTARYYFGQPVSSGKVRWQVVRQPRYPWWWGWYRLPMGQPQTIATGASALKEDGTFSLGFKPEAEEGVFNAEVSYAYSVTAEITDDGGETRTATRSYSIGFTSVTARIDSDVGFFRTPDAVAFTVRRTDLDGNPRAGAGRWKIVALRQPEEALLPADEPFPAPPKGQEKPDLQTPGDLLRPRWIGQYEPAQTLRVWADGEILAQGELGVTEAESAVRAKLPRGGAYRLRYETQDDFGTKFETQHEFVVAGGQAPISVPAAMWSEAPSVTAGGVARVLIASGLSHQPALLEIRRPNKAIERRLLTLNKQSALIELPITVEDRGGLQLSLVAVRDFQLMQFNETIAVPFDQKDLQVEFSTFRDRLAPGAKETFLVTVKGARGEKLERGAAEVLAYMYDRSLDTFAPHNPANPRSLFGQRSVFGWLRSTLGPGQVSWVWNEDFPSIPGVAELTPATFKATEGYGVGGMGGRSRRGGEAYADKPVARAPASVALERKSSALESDERLQEVAANKAPPPPPPPPGQTAPGEAAPAPQLRSNFSETAFFSPQLLVDAQGNATFEFTVPDSVTSWNVWAHAITRDLRSGSVKKETRSIKELMVRPYLPRFFREGDEAELQVVINSAAAKDASGELTLEITDTELNKPATAAFLPQGQSASRKFTVAAGKSTTVSFPLKAPKRVRTYAFKVVARAGAFSDGEVRPVPVLPSRIHLAQSRFVTLHDAAKKTMRFEDLAKSDDPTRQTEQLVVTVDAQLFYTALQALPYLLTYPYECTEQTLNRFVSTGIVSSLYKQYPAIGRMAQQFSARKTQLEPWDAQDPNRKLMLEESPWLETAKGGTAGEDVMVNVLDPKIAREQRDAAMAKLAKMQTSVGAFPWFPGGPPSPYMTLYLLHGFARASEYGVEVPKPMVQRAWAYVAQHYREQYAPKLGGKEPWGIEFVTFLNYVASSFPDASYVGEAISAEERRAMLDYSFKHWRSHSPYLKGYLSLTLARMGRREDARTVFASVMDSAKTTEEEGTFWAPEDRGWLWYNDRIETHAFALRVLMELEPKDARRHGLVQWLLINKKLSHWRSTRATAEAIYALVKYLEKEGALGIREAITVTAAGKTTRLEFKPDEYTGKKNQLVLEGAQVDAEPKKASEIVVEKTTKGFAFASATWHFATDQLPTEERGDFFTVSRRYFRRDKQGKEVVLQPLADGTPLKIGDEVEVQLSIRAKHAAEFVHLKDPRAAGLEPDRAVSGYKWETGVAFYEETRDAATNFFFDWLPAGEYTLRYRLRANMAGTFRVGPSTLQSMYAPEFNAYSAGYSMKVGQ